MSTEPDKYMVKTALVQTSSSFPKKIWIKIKRPVYICQLPCVIPLEGPQENK